MNKEDIKHEEYIGALLALRQETENRFVEAFLTNLAYPSEDKYLRFEAKAFSFWILMISLPEEDKEFFDLIHDTYFKSAELSSEQIQMVYEELTKRYEKYRDAYNSFVESKGNSAIGEVLITVVKNRNIDFSSRDDLISKTMAGIIPRLDVFEVGQAHSIFDNLFKMNIEVASDIRKTFKSDKKSDDAMRILSQTVENLSGGDKDTAIDYLKMLITNEYRNNGKEMPSDEEINSMAERQYASFEVVAEK